MTTTNAAERPDAPTLLVGGTASHVGKSTVAAGLCRYFADRGVDVAPFKAQNMSNNARAVPRAPQPGETSGGDSGAYGEIGVSQYVQARAARRPASTDCNPVLLKPRGDGESQLVLDGEAVGHFPAGRYYDERWGRAREAAVDAHRRLTADADLIVAEGAGGMGEINLHDRDLANVEIARFADAAVVLVADIDRGGAFASLVGTLELLPEDVRERVVGCAITKFRGDRSILEPGVDEFECRAGVPVLGVLPYDDPGLPAEDSVSLPSAGERAVRGDEGNVPDHRSVTVAVPRLPRVSNFTDLAPLERIPDVRVSYRPLDAEYGDADAVVVPGTKNTVDDLLALRAAGLDHQLRAFDGPIVGLCGGYQLLGERITGADVEGTGERSVVEGVGLLPVETAFSTEKRVERVERELHGVGPLAGANGTISGYEIHAGETTATDSVERPFEGRGAAVGDVLGTYLHGLFENPGARAAFVDAAFAAAGRERRPAAVEGRIEDAPDPYDRAAALIDEHVDVAALVGSIDGFDGADTRRRKL